MAARQSAKKISRPMNMDRKTYEEHRAYLHDIVRLQLWFAWCRFDALRAHFEMLALARP